MIEISILRFTNWVFWFGQKEMNSKAVLTSIISLQHSCACCPRSCVRSV